MDFQKSKKQKMNQTNSQKNNKTIAAATKSKNTKKEIQKLFLDFPHSKNV